MTPKPFNWLEFLEGAVKQEPGWDERIKVSDLAADWPTCACSELCASIPRNLSGSPKDPILLGLGVGFCESINLRFWKKALATFRAIEARTAVLLAEMAVGK